MKHQWLNCEENFNFPIEIMIEMPVFQIFWLEIINLAKMFQNTGSLLNYLQKENLNLPR
jgi:hypothetical protein